MLCKNINSLGSSTTILMILTLSRFWGVDFCKSLRFRVKSCVARESEPESSAIESAMSDCIGKVYFFLHSNRCARAIRDLFFLDFDFFLKLPLVCPGGVSALESIAKNKL